MQELQAREHHWLADKARGEGGEGLGPTPHELLLGSFAAWTAIGLFDLAREKEWAVDAVEVGISRADDGGNGFDPRAPLLREVRVRGELNDEERRELEGDVAERWPRAAWLVPGELEERFEYE